MAPVLPRPCLCLVTDRHACHSSDLAAAVAAAVGGGVDMVQLREKDLPGGLLLDLACRIKQTIDDKALLIINDRIDIALACGADGVQLGEEGLPVSVARSLGGPELLIGRSVHSVDAALQAQQDGADFLVVGTIFPSKSHAGADTAGVELIEQISRQVNVPLLGIGGITSDNVGHVMRAGAWGAAVIRAILASPDLKGAARDLKLSMVRGAVGQDVGGRREQSA